MSICCGLPYRNSLIDNAELINKIFAHSPFDSTIIVFFHAFFIRVMYLTTSKSNGKDTAFESNYLRIVRYLNLAKNQRILFATNRKVTSLTTL
jgi:hypothetical protein